MPRAGKTRYNYNQADTKSDELIALFNKVSAKKVL